MRAMNHLTSLASLKILALGLLLAGAAGATEDAARLKPSADGALVLDAASGLAWSRCVEGMSWDGRQCHGEAARLTHAQALASARARSQAEGRLWRVPRVMELRQLAGHLAQSHEPAARLFPAAPTGWYWTSSVRLETESVNPYAYRNVERGATGGPQMLIDPMRGWVAQPDSGESRGDVSKREKLPVRLVRAAD